MYSLALASCVNISTPLSETDTVSPVNKKPRFNFPRELRLRGQSAFKHVHDAKVRRESGPLLVYARPNSLEESRIGLAIGRAVGGAVRRNRIKRRLREAFRQNRHEWPMGYDWMVVVRPHKPVEIAEYARRLQELTSQLDDVWKKRT